MIINNCDKTFGSVEIDASIEGTIMFKHSCTLVLTNFRIKIDSQKRQTRKQLASHEDSGGHKQDVTNENWGRQRDGGRWYWLTYQTLKFISNHSGTEFYVGVEIESLPILIANQLILR